MAIAAMNGRLCPEHTLPAPVSGKIGVWSKPDSVVYFDDLSRSAGSPPLGLKRLKLP
jgi:hypothetical protein